MYADLFVKNLRTGRLERSSNAVDVASGAAFADVRSLVVTRGGAIAWVVRPFNDTMKPLPYEVAKFDRGGARMLDSGAGIRGKSLVRRGNRISWRNGTTRRSATLRDPGKVASKAALAPPRTGVTVCQSSGSARDRDP
jgi:hypothetical protein